MTTRILLLGLGCVGGCCYQMLTHYFKNVSLTILDKMKDLDKEIKRYKDTSKLDMNFDTKSIEAEIKESNYKDLLLPLFKTHDAVLNLTTRVNSKNLILLANECNIPYLDAAVELFTTCRVSIYDRHQELYDLRDSIKSTCILEHGMNPGIISYFSRIGQEHCGFKPDICYITEYDTHILKPEFKDKDSFYNTWSPYGLYEEATEQAECSWNQNFKNKSFDKKEHFVQNGQMLLFNYPGYQVELEAFTPDILGDLVKWIKYKGAVVTHGETETISKRIGNVNCAFVFRVCPNAKEGLNKWGMEEAPKYVQMQGQYIQSGNDTIGCLLGKKDRNLWWIGNKVTNEEAISLVSCIQNGATITVAAACLAGIKWALNNPNKGLLFPDEIEDYKTIWEDTKPFMGTILSTELPHAFEELNLHPFYVGN